MKTVKLPMLEANLSTAAVKETLIAHGVRGGVVKRGTGYDFIGLEDVIEALGRAENLPLSEIEGSKVSDSDILHPANEPKWVQIKIGAKFQFAAPLYVCPKGDYAQNGQGKCPNDNETLVRANDTI